MTKMVDRFQLEVVVDTGIGSFSLLGYLRLRVVAKVGVRSGRASMNAPIGHSHYPLVIQ